MRKATLTAEIVAVDKASSNMNKITSTAKKMSGTITKESTIAGNAFTKFSAKVGMAVKKTMVSLNNLNARVNRVGRSIKKGLGTVGVGIGLAALTMGVGKTIDKFAEFEQSNVGLTAVMGTTLDQNKALIIDAKRLGATTAKTATQVVSLQEAFARLGFAEKDIINMTESTISGSVAMKSELADTAELVGAMVSSFDKFESVNAPGIIDKMTLATQKSALNFTKLQTSLPIVAGAANAAKVPFTKLLASLGKLSDAGIDASSSSTALRNIFLEAAKRGVPYEELLKKVAGSTDKLKTANELFGKRGAVVAVVLAKNIAKVNELDVALQGAAGTAGTAAAKQLDTLKGSLTILGSAWEGYILNIEDGTGAFGEFLKTSVRVVTEILSIASGTQKASDKLTDAELRIRSLAERGIILLKVLKAIGLAFVAFKVAILALRAATFAYNIVLGIQSALIGTASIAMRANTTAIWVMNAATKAMAIATSLYNLGLTGAVVATWSFTAALLANPITWVVLAIAALIAGIVLLVKHFDKVKIAMQNAWAVIENNILLKLLILPTYILIKAIQSLVQNFDAIKTAIGNFFASIAENPIVQFLLFPIFLVIEAIKFLIQNFDAIKEVVMTVFNAIKENVLAVFEFFGALGNYIGAVFTIAYNNIMDRFVRPFIEGFKNAFNFIAANVKIFAEKLKAPFLPIIEFFNQMGEAIKTSIVDKFKAIGEFVAKIINTVTKFFKGSTEKLNAKTEQLITVNQGKNEEVGKAAEDQVKSQEVVITNEKDIANETVKNKTIENDIVNTNEKNISKEMPKKMIGNNPGLEAGKWKGNFKTSISNSGIGEKGITNEIANNAISNEKNIINEQKDVISNKSKSLVEQKSVTNTSTSNVFNNQKSAVAPKSEITINLIDKTGGKFGIEVEDTGVKVVTTGNDV